MLRILHLLTVTLGLCLISAAAAAGPSDFDKASLFRASCAPCHGETGMGGGSVAAALKDPIPVLATLTRRHGGDLSRRLLFTGSSTGARWCRPHGTRTMPVWAMISSCSMKVTAGKVRPTS